VVQQLTNQGLPLAVVCHTLGVPRSGYYAFTQGAGSARAHDDARLRPLVQQVFWDHKRRYGARRIAAELRVRAVVRDASPAC
jgi:putative transposase